jgi:hypothetical protein
MGSWSLAKEPIKVNKVVQGMEIGKNGTQETWERWSYIVKIRKVGEKTCLVNWNNAWI